MSFNSCVAQSLRKRRESAGWSQEDVAKALEISQSTWARLETGKLAITVVYLYKFGKFIECDPCLFLNDALVLMAAYHAARTSAEPTNA